MSVRFSQNIRIHTDTSESGPPSTHLAHSLAPIQASEALSPINLPAMNSLNGNTDPSQRARTPNSIRTVPAEPLQLDTISSTSNDDSRRSLGKKESAGLSVGAPAGVPSSKSYGNMSSGPPLSWQNNPSVSKGLVRSISSEFGPMKGYANGNTNTADDTNGVVSPTNGDPKWSAAVGGASLGRSGRVIEKLMGENDSLKRELKVERLRLEEARQAHRLAESRMDTMAVNLERSITDAALNEMALKRRDRQLAESRAEVDYERSKATDAEQREKEWKDHLEVVQERSMRDVEKYKERAMHAESSYTTLQSHWPGEKARLDQGVSSIRKEINSVVIERKKDDEQISMLKSLSDQQAEQILVLQTQNAAILKAHEAYKEAQEKALHDIKANAKQQEAENEKFVQDAKKLSGELRWALGVKESMRDSQ